MKQFKAAIFDLDGTLIDSMGVWEQIDREFLSKRGIAIPEDYIAAVTPMGFRSAAEYTIRRFCLQETPADLIREWEDMAIDAYSFHVPLKPHAKEYLEYLKEKGVRLAVATALQPTLSVPVLKNNGVYGYFESFASVTEVVRGKGHPDIYLLAAERLRIKPEECMVFEDILAGVQGAKKAGMAACGVYDSYSEEDQKEMQALCDLYIHDFAELIQTV